MFNRFNLSDKYIPFIPGSALDLLASRLPVTGTMYNMQTSLADNLPDCESLDALDVNGFTPPALKPDATTVRFTPRPGMPMDSAIADFADLTHCLKPGEVASTEINGVHLSTARPVSINELIESVPEWRKPPKSAFTLDNNEYKYKIEFANALRRGPHGLASVVTWSVRGLSERRALEKFAEMVCRDDKSSGREHRLVIGGEIFCSVQAGSYYENIVRRFTQV